VRNIVALMLLAGCNPSLPVLNSGPLPVDGPVLRDMGPFGGRGARRIQIDLPASGYVLVVAGHGRARLEPVALSVAPSREFSAGRHPVVALLGVGPPIGVASATCSNPVIYMQAAFPGPSGHLPLAALSDPPLPAVSGPTPVILNEPDGKRCSPRSLAPPSALYLLVAPEPLGPRLAEAAIDRIPPGTAEPEAARLLASALGASLTLLQ
jgi:hypothetical protein